MLTCDQIPEQLLGSQGGNSCCSSSNETTVANGTCPGRDALQAQSRKVLVARRC